MLGVAHQATGPASGIDYRNGSVLFLCWSLLDWDLGQRWTIGRVQNKGAVLTIGTLCFLGVALLPFLLFTPPTETSTAGWGLTDLVMLYTLHGTGRAAFEGTLKGTHRFKRAPFAALVYTSHLLYLWNGVHSLIVKTGGKIQ